MGLGSIAAGLGAVALVYLWFEYGASPAREAEAAAAAQRGACRPGG